MIIKSKFNNVNATFIDGFLTKKRWVDECFKDKSIEALREDPTRYRIQQENPYLSNLDNKYVSLLSLYESEMRGNEESVLLYIVPPFQKPNYASIIRHLNSGTYRVEELQFLRYGPRSTSYRSRKDRYRQLIYLEPNRKESSIDDDRFAEIIAKTSFLDIRTTFSYQPYTMRGDIFEFEVNYFNRRLSDAVLTDKLETAMTDIKKNSDISIFRIL